MGAVLPETPRPLSFAKVMVLSPQSTLTGLLLPKMANFLPVFPGLALATPRRVYMYTTCESLCVLTLVLVSTNLPNRQKWPKSKGW